MIKSVGQRLETIRDADNFAEQDCTSFECGISLGLRIGPPIPPDRYSQMSFSGTQ